MTQTSAVKKLNPLEELEHHHVKFVRDEAGLDYIEIDNDYATAKIALQGAHIMAWQPKSQKNPVLWLSSNARYVPGRSIRGGIPICWPWFGAHPTDGTLCPHGFARVMPWQLIDAETVKNGATRLVLQMLEPAESKRQLSYPYLLTITITVGDTLRIDLATTNKADHPFMVGEALHTYFQVSDVAAIHIHGLEDALYADKVFNYERRVETTDVRFNSEFDRVYLNTNADCVIHDPGLNRQIRIAKSGSQSTVIWNPWQEKAQQMADMGTANEWRNMICVETANALENSVVISPNRTHTMSVEYSVESL
jgi:glucose-6-phosphate 1-epimerase